MKWTAAPHRDDLVDDVAHVAQRTRKSLHRRNANGVSIPDALDALVERDTVVLTASADLVEEDPVDVANRFELAGEILRVGTDADVPNGLCALRHL